MTGRPSDTTPVRPSAQGAAAADGVVVRSGRLETDGFRWAQLWTPGKDADEPQRTGAVDGDTQPPVDADPEPSTTDAAADRPVRHENPEPRWLKIGLNGALWIESGVATLMASKGQVGFAKWADITGRARFGVPVILECFAVVLLLLGYQQGRRKRSPYPLWLLAAGVGGFAVYTNVVHAGHRAGLVYGAASAAALISWFVKLRLDLTHYLIAIRHLPPRRPKLGALMFTNRRLAVRAQLIAIERRLTDTDVIVNLAGVFLAIYDDTRAHLISKGKGHGEAKRLAKRTAWRTIYRMSGAPIVELPHTAEIETVEVTVRTVDEDHGAAEADGAKVPERTADRTDPSDTLDASADGDRPKPRKPSGRKSSSDRRADVHIVWSETVRANAAALRARYGDQLPQWRGRVSGRKVRDDMDWSNDKASPAIRAYLAGADRENKTRPEPSDDEEHHPASRELAEAR